MSNNNNLVAHKLDLEEIDKIPSLINIINSEYGPIYGLVNNAGIGLDGLLATQHQKDIKKILTINLEAPIILSKYACRSMLSKKEGRIINITSIIAKTGYNGLSLFMGLLRLV